MVALQERGVRRNVPAGTCCRNPSRTTLTACLRVAAHRRKDTVRRLGGGVLVGPQHEGVRWEIQEDMEESQSRRTDRPEDLIAVPVIHQRGATAPPSS